MKLKNIKFFFRVSVPDKNKILIFDEEGSEDFKHSDAEGFIRLNALRLKRSREIFG